MLCRAAVSLLVAAFALLWTLLWTTAAHACKCAAPPPPSEARQSAAAVFEGRVTKLSPLGNQDLVVELSVVRAWKAADAEQILVRTRQDSAACGFPFAVGESYLVYADHAEPDAQLPGLQVLHCGRTRLITEADADIVELGMGAVPVKAAPHELAQDAGSTEKSAAPGAIAAQRDKPAAGGCASCSALGARSGAASPGVLGLALAALAVARARRHSRRTEPFSRGRSRSRS